jgi:hypothetical protein
MSPAIFITSARVWPTESFRGPAARSAALRLASKRLSTINPAEATRIKRLCSVFPGKGRAHA